MKESPKSQQYSWSTTDLSKNPLTSWSALGMAVSDLATSVATSDLVTSVTTSVQSTGTIVVESAYAVSSTAFDTAKSAAQATVSSLSEYTGFIYNRASGQLTISYEQAKALGLLNADTSNPLLSWKALFKAVGSLRSGETVTIEATPEQIETLASLDQAKTTEVSPS